MKKEVVKYLKSMYEVGVRLASNVVGISRSTFYYQSKLDDSQIIEKLKEIADKYPNRGFENYYYRLKREGYQWGRNRVLRVYRELGLVRRSKKRKKLPEGLRQPLYNPSELNEVWSMDFMSDTLDDGRPFRILNVIDDCNRECLISQGSISFPALRVIRELDKVAQQIGYPNCIRTDNGPEFIAKDYKQWAIKNNIKLVYSQPGKPMQNGYVERFNRTLREDVLDAYIFSSITQFNLLSEAWREDYNLYHPHKALGRKSPEEFKNRRQPLGVDVCQNIII